MKSSSIESCLQSLCEAQIEYGPDRTALQFVDEQLTYGMVNEKASSLAYFLQSQGVGPNVRVGLCLERSLELVIGILGVLKAGGAYVPLDPEYPQERLTFLLTDAHVRLVLTQMHLSSRFASCSLPIFSLDDEQFIQDSQKNVYNSPQDLTPDYLAYVLYTSGSTGLPKGVMVSHRSIVNRLVWGQNALPLDSQDRVLQIASASFDISIWEFFGPLMAGARIIMAEPANHKDIGYLLKLLKDYQVTVAHFVPSLLRTLVELPEFADYVGLRAVFCGGEAIPPELPALFFACSQAELWQFYGPTEAAINATYTIFQPGESVQKISLGQPIANTQIYLLDEEQQPVEVGTPGEIFIGGRGLAQGYQGRADLTAERFLPHPWSVEPGSRLYRTGDIARYEPDGTLLFLGRSDDQIKLRGMRIELREIELAIRQHPAVRDVVVITHQDTPGDIQLVAYIVSKQEQYITNNEIRRMLSNQLPDYMVPTFIIKIDEMPLLPSGKVNREALPGPNNVRCLIDTPYVAPRNSVEEAIASIWCELLHTDNIGIYDDFFEMGGHSLSAAQAIKRINSHFRQENSLKILFEYPTIVGLAEVIVRSPE